METEAEHLDLERVLVVLRRRWWVIVLVTVLVTGATSRSLSGSTMYVMNWSLWEDVRLMLRTLPVVIGGRGAN